MPAEVRFPEAATALYCAFDEPWDRDFDGWPDGWTRRRGPAFPHYVKIELTDDGDSEGGRCLRIDLDGGAAAAYSPPVPVDALFGYVLEGRLKTEGLDHDRAYLSITLLDENRRPLAAYTSSKVRETDGWRTLGLGPIAPKDDRARFALVGLHVEPTSREDLTGSVLLSDVWLGRLPRMTLRTSDPYHFFTDPAQFAVECTVSGEIEDETQITFVVEDVLRRELARAVRPMATRPADVRDDLSLEEVSGLRRATIATARWEPPIEGPGFYRVTAMIPGPSGSRRSKTISLAIVEPRRPPVEGRFGWSLPRGDRPLPPADLSRIVLQAGVNWVKYPVWYSEQQGEQYVQRLIGFEQRLGDRGVKLVALLGEPPEPLRRQYGTGSPLSAADVFAAGPDVWYPSLQPVITRLATQVRWWQLGTDTDASFAGHAGLEAKIAQVKGELDRIGLDMNVGLGWTWLDALPEARADRPPWSFVSLLAGESLGAEELADHLETTRDAGVRRWVSIEPLSRQEHAPAERATDLLRRMIAAKVHGADAIFCPDPFDPDHGLMNADGTPGELLLPWRTTALLLGGTEYLGSIELPGGSSNHVFARGDEAVMVVWSDRAGEEAIFLGDDVRQVDLWGRSTTPARREHRQVIRVDRLPSFVTGVNGPITRWRMDCQLARDRIPSIFGRPHANTLRLKNWFVGAVSGRMELVAPSTWSVEPNQDVVELAGAETLAYPLTVLLPLDADSGEHRVRIDFEIDAERPYRFSVYRKLNVGLGPLRLDVHTRLDDQGNLEVHQLLVNEGDTTVSFQCQLFAPGRRRLASHIASLPRSRDAHVYRLENGRELLGRTLWLRAEELGGPRVLSHRFTAEDGGSGE